jgi:hypothetical protein
MTVIPMTVIPMAVLPMTVILITIIPARLDLYQALEWCARKSCQETVGSCTYCAKACTD